MDFFVDFEAYQPSGHILSIGCVAAGSESFVYELCKCPDEKVSDFITGLTGITSEMVDQQGYSYNTAFEAFFNYITWNQIDGSAPKFYVYSKEDANFIKATLPYLTSPNAYAAAAMVLAGMVDLSVLVRQHLATNGISLKRALELVRHEEVIQKHNALDDAMMLEELAVNFRNLAPLNDAPKNNVPGEVKKTGNPDVELMRKFVFGNYSRVEAPTGSEDNWAFSYTRGDCGGKPKYFSDTRTFAVWYIHYIQHKSVKHKHPVDDIEHSIQRALTAKQPTWKKGKLIINPIESED